MTSTTLRLEPLPALRLAQVSGEVNDASEIRAMVGALAGELAARLAAAGVAMSGRVCVYEGRSDGSKIDVAVGVRLAPDEESIAGLESVGLPGLEHGAVVRHRRTRDDAVDPWLTIDAALAERGLESFGPYRQVELPGVEGGERVDELQCPVRDSRGACP